MKKAAFKTSVGSRWNIPVKQEHIQDSDPCKKTNCMLTRALVDFLGTLFGEPASKYHVKSTNHGAIFDLHGRRLLVVFDRKTSVKIYNYDCTYTKTRNKTRAIASVKPFKAKIMIESNTAVPKYPPMSEETKAKLQARERTEHGYRPTLGGSRRQLSL